VPRVQRPDFSRFQVIGAETERNVPPMHYVTSLVASAVLVVACAAPEDLAAQTATLSDYCQARAKTECTSLVVTSCKSKDAATCVTDRQAECMKNIPQGTVYVPAAAPACLQVVADAYATATLSATSLTTIATTCEPVFSGPGAARTPCDVDYDCSMKDGLRCVIPFDETSGKCLQPNIIEAGGPCPNEGDVCSGPYYCDPQSKVCTAEGGEGSQCSNGYEPCMTGYKCPGLGPFGATCTALGQAGEACVSGDDCQSGLCDKATGQSQGNCADQVQLTALDSLCAPYQ
jgi:hypothetical protein